MGIDSSGRNNPHPSPSINGGEAKTSLSLSNGNYAACFEPEGRLSRAFAGATIEVPVVLELPGGTSNDDVYVFA